MKTTTVYIVRYNDCYGNGDDKKLEVVLKNKAAFNQWHKAHNKKRKEDGNAPEGREEFDLIPIQMVLSF